MTTQASSAFADKASVPTEDAVEDVLGPDFPLWRSVKALLAQDFDPLLEGWSFGRNRMRS